MDAEGGKSPGQFNVEDLGVDIRGAGQLLVFGDHFLLDPAALHPRHGQECRQAAGRRREMVVHFCLVMSPSEAKLASGLSGSGVRVPAPFPQFPASISAAEKPSVNPVRYPLSAFRCASRNVLAAAPAKCPPKQLPIRVCSVWKSVTMCQSNVSVWKSFVQIFCRLMD